MTPALLRSSRPLPALLLAWLCLLPAPLPARAQEAPPTVQSADEGLRLTLGGQLQARLSYGLTDPPTGADVVRRERIGFGLRRARFRVQALLGRAGAFLQLDGAGGTLRAVDAYGSYRLGRRLRLRLGRLAGAQPRSMILTSSTRIDAVDRPAIAERWARSTLGGDGRDFGVDLHYRAPHAEVMLFVHNGDGSWDRLRGNVRQGPGDGNATGGVETEGLAVSVAGALRPGRPGGLEVGGFAGFNGSRNPNTRPDADGPGRAYLTYGAHAYWGAEPGSRPFRLKADALGIVYERRTRRDARQHTLGVALLAAVRLHRAAEVFARAEQYIPDLDADATGDVYVTGGASLSLSALDGRPYPRERLTLAYSVLRPAADAAPTEHLVVLQLQLAF